MPLVEQFLLTPPGGGDQGVAIIVRKRLCKFLLTPPGGGDLGNIDIRKKLINFYSRPRAGAIRQFRRRGRRLCAISTHAPGRGRSDSPGPFRPPASISTHAPGRGRSGVFAFGSIPHINFYSRPRAGAILLPRRCILTGSISFLLTPPGGGDPSGRNSDVSAKGISTHAPGRGRSLPLHALEYRSEFLLTPPGGGDPLNPAALP